MSINYFAEDISIPKIKRRLTSGWIKNTIVSEGKFPGDISFIFCSDDYLLDVNRKFLQHDYFTDIITFDYVEHGQVNGDIFISVDRVKENAGMFSKTFENELNRILIHGILHLLGYKDKEKRDKELMTEREDFYLNRLDEIK
ncbi:MAG: rRNA maturation RNase YbeY [Prolixibacteraceae bacterium]|jgi:rRNA maturation RNase YbeY